MPNNNFPCTQNLPISTASVVMRVVNYSKGSPNIYRTEIEDRSPDSKTNGYTFDLKYVTLHGKVPITFSLEFLDLKMMERGNYDDNYYSIWNDEEYREHNSSNEGIIRMLSDSIYTDIVINTTNGSIKAHRAVLAANSPVFEIMFSKKLQRKRNIYSKYLLTCR